MEKISGKSWHSIPEYEALRALIQTGTATAAAASLGVSQSAISRSISSLEARMGRTYFERTSGRLTPTQEAMTLNRRLDSLFDALDLIDGTSEPVEETLHLHAPPSFAHTFLVDQIGRFLQMNPHFYVRLEVGTSEEVARAVLEQRSDLGLCSVDYSRAGLKQLPFRSARAVCAMARDHPLAEREEIHPADLDGQDLITFLPRQTRRGQLDRILAQAQSRVHLVAEVSTSFAAAEFASTGLGVSVVNPFPIHYRKPERLEFRPFIAPITYRVNFMVADTRPVPRIARAFMRHLRLYTPNDRFSEKG
ncbi:LysR family transcriptional regulator [Tritonibacter litoralis]|uniref:LysR family transcriptional regulator n=1 Tax=Tritonibacter litoralis TaxID=2662264 RepID=UPI0031B5EA85